MKLLLELKYFKDYEWVKVIDGDVVYIGIIDYV